MYADLKTMLLETPEISAVLVLVLGLVVARLVSNGVERLAQSLDRWLTRYATGETYIGSTKWITVAKGTAFWVTLLFAVLVALRLIGVGGVATVLDSTIRFIPQLVVGLIIVAAGHLLGVLAGNLLSRSTVVDANALAPRLVYAGVFAVAVVMGMQQMGIDTTFLTQLALVVIIVVMGGLTLAFALGARPHVENLIARSELQRYRVGEQIRVGDIEGTIVDIRATGVDLRSAQGLVAIPASMFSHASVVTLTGEEDD